MFKQNMDKIFESHISGENIAVNSELFPCVSNLVSEQHSCVQKNSIEGNINDPVPINEAQLDEEHSDKVLQNELLTDNKLQFVVKDGSVGVDKCNLYVASELENSFLCEEMFMLDEESGERRTVIRYINQNDKDMSDDHFNVDRENISNEPPNAEFINCCASDIDSSYGVSDTQGSILSETNSNICVIESTTSLSDDISTEQCSEKDPLTIEEQLVILSNDTHVKSERKVYSSESQEISVINDVPVTTTYIETSLSHNVSSDSNKSTNQCERDLNNLPSFSSDDKITDYKSVAANLFKTCTEVDDILKCIGQDDSFVKSSPYSNNTEQTVETPMDDNIVYKCGLCSFVDKNIEKLAVHIHSCGLKHKSSQGDGDGAPKKHQVPVPIAPRCDLPPGLPVSSNPQYIIATPNKISATPKIKIALTSQPRISSSTTHVHSQFTPAQTKLVSSHQTLSSSNTHYFITSQHSVSFAQNTPHNVPKPQVPNIPSTPIAISQSQIPVLPSAQLAVTSQGQLTLAQPGTQLLITTKPPFHNTVSGRQPTLLGVGIGTNPTLAAKNIVLLPNLILNSPTTVSSQQNGAKPNISLQPPIVLQNSMPINSVSSMPFQQSVLFTPPALSSQPQVLLSPIYLSDGSVSNENSVANMPQPQTVNQSSTKKKINTSKSLSAKKQDRSHVVSKPIKSSNKPAYICELCDDHLTDLVKLKNHMKCLHEIRIHPKTMPCFNCQKCQYCFFTEQGLGRHLVGSHGLVTASMQEAADQGKDGGRCPICGWGYQNKILDHIALDHKVSLKPTDLTYKCTLCTSKFGVYKQFEKHVYSAHRADLSKMSKLRRK